MPIPFSFDRSVGGSNYNALEVSLEKRYSKGLALTVSYSYSKSLDYGASGLFSIEGFSVENPYNITRDYAPSSFNIPHNLTVSWVYQLPFGTGRQFSSGNKIVDAVVGNWQWNGIADIRSGQNFNLTVNGDIANTGNFGYERPDVVGDFHLPQHSVRVVQDSSLRRASAVYLRKWGPESLTHAVRACLQYGIIQANSHT